MRNLVLSVGWASLLFACAGKQDTQVGSNCDQDCELQSAKVSCTMLTTKMDATFSTELPDGGAAYLSDGGVWSSGLFHICLPSEISAVGGKLTCELIATPTSGDLEAFCASSPALTPTGSDAPIAGCVLTQASDVDSEAPGWFYDLHAGDCSATFQVGIGFRGYLPPDFELHVSCIAAVVSTGAYVPGAAAPEAPIPVDPQDCRFAAAPSAEAVGDACLPAYVPEYGFDARQQAFVETEPAACPGGVCLVAFNVLGDPRSDCVESLPGHRQQVCLDPEEAIKHIYCSCDCGDLDGRLGCECPAGYSCEQVLEENTTLQSPPVGTSGRYCVKGLQTR